MPRSIIVCLVFILALAFMISCSGGSGDVVTPPPVDRTPVAEPTGTTNLLGLWQVTVDTNAGTIEAVDLRSSDLMINVLGFMEPPPLSSMSIDFGSLVFADPLLDVDVIFTHPIPDPVFMGFDARGVVFGPELVNADGLTVVCSPEFFAGVPFGYQDGMLGAPDSYAHYEGLAGYKYFCDGLGMNEVLSDFMSVEGNLLDRGVFSEAPTTHKRHYTLSWEDTSPPIGYMVFNYAVYANYNWPIGDPVDNVDDFDITTANSAEAFCCKVTELANSLYFATGGGGGEISLMVEAWDWQGNITDVTIESLEAGVITQTSYDVISGPGTSKSTNYDFYAVPGTPTEVGDLDILITVTDEVTFGAAWFMGLLPPGHMMYDELAYNCFIHTTTVIECPPATVTSIDPDAAWPDQTVSTTITGQFIDGTSLAARLTMTGETDIVGDPVVFVSDTEITADFDLTGATYGDWTVVVTNGCGTDGELVDGFNVKGCPSTNLPSTVARWTGSSSGAIYAYMGVSVTRGTNQYLIGWAYPSNTDALRCIDLDDTWTSGNFHTGWSHPSSYYPHTYGGFVVDDDDRVYYMVRTSGSYKARYRVYYMDWDESTETWGSYTAMPAITAGPNQYAYHLAIDDAGNPIVYAGYSSNVKYLHHWNPSTSSWDGIQLNNSAFTGGPYYSDVKGIHWNESTSTYILTYNYIDWTYYNMISNIICFDSTGQKVWSHENIYNPSGSWLFYPCGSWVDYKDSDCRVLCFEGQCNSSAVNWYRCNAIGGDETHSTWNMGSSYYPSYYCLNNGWSTEKELLYMPQQTVTVAIITPPSDW